MENLNTWHLECVDLVICTLKKVAPHWALLVLLVLAKNNNKLETCSVAVLLEEEKRKKNYAISKFNRQYIW